MAAQLIANARMYAVAPGAAAAWKRLFAWLRDATGVDLAIIDHAFPALLDALWRRDDLAATFMCGWPWLRLGLGHRIVAAPVPAAEWAGGRPVYCTHFVVRADSPFRTLEDTFGHRFAFTIEDSHSGYNAPRHHLLPYRSPARPRLYREIIGPLTTPRRMLEAIVEGRTDVGPLDSFAFALLQRHEPALASPVRVIASTPTVPIPAIVASRDMSDDVVGRLRGALLTVADRCELAGLRADLSISGFAPLEPASYAISETWAKAAEAIGERTIT
jgi:ABC-type phosphate/phosphonate transport system substrate-binding protein